MWDRLATPSPAERRHALLLFGIVALGFFLRLWHVGTLTEGMLYDEAYKGLDAIAIRELGERPVFLDWNGGREALVAYTVAAAQSFLDYTIASVRIISALYGSLTLIFFYYFVSRLWTRNVALVGTFLMAVSKYHIIHSRLGVRAGHFTMFEVASLCFLAAGLYAERRRNLWLILAGIMGGLGFHTYIAYRIFPAVAATFLASKDRLMRLRTQWKGAVAGLILAVLILLPLAIFYVNNYQSMTDRMKRTAVWNQKGKTHRESPARLVLQATLDTLGMFNFRGDRIERHNVEAEPMLSPFTGPFLLAGIVLTLLCLNRRLALFLLMYLFLTLLPGFLSVDSPNTARVLGSIPPAMILCSLGICALTQVVMNFSRPLTTLIVGIVLGGSAYTGINDALLRYPLRLDALPPQISNIWGLDREPARAADLLNRLGPRCAGFTTPQFFFHSAVEYLTYSKSEHQLFLPNTNLQEKSKGNVAVILLQPNRPMNLWFLRDDDGKRFYKWWRQRYGWDYPRIRSMIRSTYGENPALTKTSDQRLLRVLRQRYPNGKYLDFETFAAYVVRP